MTKEELIKAAKERPVTEETIKAFEKRIAEREKEFAEWERSQRQFDYNFRYTI